jgi:hypothetical protein
MSILTECPTVGGATEKDDTTSPYNRSFLNFQWLKKCVWISINQIIHSWIVRNILNYISYAHGL